MRKPLLLVAAIGAAMAVVTPDTLRAQDCGEECRYCGEDQWEGMTYSGEDGEYNMICVPTDGGCLELGCFEASVTDDTVDASLIAELIRVAASPGEIRALVAAYGHRLLLAPERAAVVVTEPSCADHRFAHMVTVGPRSLAELSAMNVMPLRTHLD